MSSNINQIKIEDKLSEIIDKIEFISNAVYIWDPDKLDFSDKHRSGFSLIADNIILDLKQISDLCRSNRA